MEILKCKIEIKTYLTNSDQQAENYLNQIESGWKKFLELLGFESQFHRYSQWVCDCDYPSRREWYYLSIDVSRNLNKKNNTFHFYQLLFSYCALIQSDEKIDYCNLTVL